jgi:chromosome segregation ATPase
LCPLTTSLDLDKEVKTSSTSPVANNSSEQQELHEMFDGILESIKGKQAQERGVLDNEISTLKQEINKLERERQTHRGLLTEEIKSRQEAKAEISQWKEKYEQVQKRWEKMVQYFADEVQSEA